MARRKLNEDQHSADGNDNDNSDDTFGLPEIDYKPLDRETTQETTTTYTETTSSDEGPSEYQTTQQEYVPAFQEEEEERSSPIGKILGVVAVLILAAAAYWFFAVYQPRKKAEIAKAKQEEEARLAAERKAEEDRLAEQRRLEEERRKADSLANATPKEGVIETLSERTGRYYVVVASAIDGDLIMDYARKLSPKGVSSKIIPPRGSVKFYRLAVADGETYADAQTLADGMKGDYGDGVWVAKY